MSGPSVAAVVVNYNTRDLLLHCVASLITAREAGELDELIVVDSGSRDDSAAGVRAAFPDLCVLEVENRGYGAAANRGLAATTAELALVLNADTVVPPGAVATLAAHMRCHAACGLAGPRLRHPDGSVQSSRRRFPTRLTPLFESTILQEWWPDNPLARRYYLADRAEDAPQKVDWLVGAALMVRRAALARVGGFDETFRMYSEEVEWCWRMRRHGWTVDYVPAAQVGHHEAASTRQDVTANRLEFDRSRILLAGRLHGRSGAALARAAVTLNYALLGGREAFKWLLGHKRELRRQRVAFYVRALVAGLRA